MKLQFKNSASIAPFISWLNGFQAIQPTLLLEIDINRQMFIAKSFPAGKTIVKYSSISFDAAGLELFGVFGNQGEKIDWNEFYDKETDGRIKVGIYEILPKVIKVYKLYTDSDHEMSIEFDVCTSVEYVQSKKAVKEYQAEHIMLHSMSLSMKIDCSQLSEFFYNCEDDTFFNKVCNIGSPSSYEVSMDAFNNLLNISSIFCKNKDKDKIKFYSKKENDRTALYAYDDSNGSFDYLLGYYTEGEEGHTETFVYTKRFEDTIKCISAESVKITLDTAGASRMLLETEDSKIIIAAVKRGND